MAIEKNMVRAGDVVKVVSLEGETTHTAWHDLKVGEHLTVVVTAQPDESDCVKCERTLDGYNCHLILWVDCSDLEFVTRKINVGDTVRVIDKTGAAGYTLGEIGIVEDVYGPDYDPLARLKGMQRGGMFHTRYERVANDYDATIKEGDTVKVIDADGDKDHCKVGDILKVDYTTCTELIVCTNGVRMNAHRFAKIDLTDLQDEAPVQASSAQEQAQPEYKQGDFIRVVSLDGPWQDAGSNAYVEIGHIYEVAEVDLEDKYLVIKGDFGSNSGIQSWWMDFSDIEPAVCKFKAGDMVDLCVDKASFSACLVPGLAYPVEYSDFEKLSGEHYYAVEVIDTANGWTQTVKESDLKLAEVAKPVTEKVVSASELVAGVSSTLSECYSERYLGFSLKLLPPQGFDGTLAQIENHCCTREQAMVLINKAFDMLENA